MELTPEVLAQFDKAKEEFKQSMYGDLCLKVDQLFASLLEQIKVASKKPCVVNGKITLPDPKVSNVNTTQRTRANGNSSKSQIMRTTNFFPPSSTSTYTSAASGIGNHVPHDQNDIDDFDPMFVADTEYMDQSNYADEDDEEVKFGVINRNECQNNPNNFDNSNNGLKHCDNDDENCDCEECEDERQNQNDINNGQHSLDNYETENSFDVIDISDSDDEESGNNDSGQMTTSASSAVNLLNGSNTTPLLEYSCNINGCTKKYNNKRSLTKHQAFQHKFIVDRYVCSYKDCGRTFGQTSDRNRHERIHRGSRPYRCRWPECNHEANQIHNITVHIRRVHFKLPHTKKQQDEQGIIDDRDPYEFIEIRTHLL